MLDQILDRRHIIDGTPTPYAMSGPGYEVVKESNNAASGGAQLLDGRALKG